MIHRRGDQGPQHRYIENHFYRVETLPRSGQIWHMWNTQGADTSWHINEWPANVDRGGDPCHWAPNCWVAYPERITNGYELDDAPGSECDFIDWHYVFGWDDPECEVVEGPVFVEIKRRGIVWPHPEHSRSEIRRDGKPRLRAEVTYRFYDRLPFIFQSSTLETLEDLNVFFIRNCQFAFRTHLFSHMIIAPERDGLRPTDEVDVAVFRLMGKANNKPYDWIQHSLSNVLPSKPAWYAYYDEDSHDGFALFPVVGAEHERLLGHTRLPEPRDAADRGPRVVDGRGTDLLVHEPALQRRERDLPAEGGALRGGELADGLPARGAGRDARARRGRRGASQEPARRHAELSRRPLRFPLAPLGSRSSSSWNRWRIGCITACSSIPSQLMSSPQRVLCVAPKLASSTPASGSRQRARRCST